jgi:hypothetical protein
MQIVLHTLSGVKMVMTIPEGTTVGDVRKQVSNYLAANCTVYNNRIRNDSIQIKQGDYLFVLMKLTGNKVPEMYRNETGKMVGESIFTIELQGTPEMVDQFLVNRKERMDMYDGYLLHNLRFPSLRQEFHKKVMPVYGIKSNRKCKCKKSKSKKYHRHSRK